jgi:hypothetical protein
MPELWVPGAPAPSLEDFVARLHESIASYAERNGMPTPWVELELVDGATFALQQLRADPGYGFITLCPYPEEGEPTEHAEEVIVPVGSIKRITLGEPEERPARFGFSGGPA